VACSGSPPRWRTLGNGWREYQVGPYVGRDFALAASARFREFAEEAGKVRLRCLAFPEHEANARVMLSAARAALLAFQDLFGPYPYQELTLVEAYLGWGVKPCSGVLVIDERLFTTPQVAAGFLEVLIAQQTAHQWWHNVIGTNSYAEAFVETGFSTFFAHRLLDHLHGRNSPLLSFPSGLRWLPQ